MNLNDIDYDDLKKRGFLRSRQEGFFILRTRMPAGNYQASHLRQLSLISEKYAQGFVHLTVRQGIEMPYIKYKDIDRVEEKIKKAGIQRGTSGPRLRTITSCPGANWCKQGLINTFSLVNRIEGEIGLCCGMDLPHKFKIVVSGCPNTCTRAQVSEIGLHGQTGIVKGKKKIGYNIYLGGCGGKTPRVGFKLKNIYTENEALSIIKKVVFFYKENANPKQRLALLIEEFGKQEFLKKIGEKAV